MMRYAEVQCQNPSCTYNKSSYGVMVEDGYHAECPGCHQVNRIPGKDLSEEIDGMCRVCRAPLDEHIYGRGDALFAHPPKKEKKE